MISTQWASQDHFCPALTNSSNSISRLFSTELTNNIELFFLGEKTSILYIDSSGTVSKNFLLSIKNESRKWLLKWNISDLSLYVSVKVRVLCCLLRGYFCLLVDENTLIIVKLDKVSEEGTHWLLTDLQQKWELPFSDPLGLQLFTYTKVFSHNLCGLWHCTS